MEATSYASVVVASTLEAKFVACFCRCNWLWCFDDDHDDVLQLMQMGFSRLKFKTILQDYKAQHQDDH